MTLQDLLTIQKALDRAYEASNDATNDGARKAWNGKQYTALVIAKGIVDYEVALATQSIEVKVTA